MTEVVLPVVKFFFSPLAILATASQNSAARLLKGHTMHYAGAMTRGQSLEIKKLKPSQNAAKRLQFLWQGLVMLLIDEASIVAL
jgi:hypothetical protein